MVVLIVLVTGGIVGVAFGHGDGGGQITGLYKTGCGPCHGRPLNNYEGNKLPDGSQAPYQLTIDGNNEITVGTTETYTVRLVAFPPNPITGGIDAAIENSSGVKDPGMAAGLNTQKVFDEITHAPDLTPWETTGTNGRIWQFTWTPSAPGTYTLYVAANAANGDTRTNDIAVLWMNTPDGLRDAWYRYWSGGQVGVGQMGYMITVN